MGPSGCGKSTLLHMLGGLDRPTSGQVLIEGVSLGTLSDDKLTQLRRRKIGFVFQFFNLIPVLNALENAVCLWRSTVPRLRRRKSARQSGWNG